MTRTSYNCTAVAALLIALGPIRVTAAPNAQREEVVRPIGRAIAIEGMVRHLYVFHQSAGNVRITTHARPEVRLSATVRASAPTRALARKFADAVRLDVRPDVYAVTVEVVHPQMSHENGSVGFAIDLDVVMPETMRLDVDHKFGDLTVSGLKGETSALLRNQSGTLTVTDWRGDMLTLENRFGLIEAARLEGTRMIRVINTSGDTRLADVTGPAQVSARSGEVRVERVRGALVAFNADGPVRASSIDGEVMLSAHFGPAVLRDITGTGRVQVNATDGSVEVVLPASPDRCRSLSVMANRSPVTVYVGDGGYKVTASADRIRTDVPITTSGTLDTRMVRGTIRGGDCSLSLNARSGDITIGHLPPTTSTPGR